MSIENDNENNNDGDFVEVWLHLTPGVDDPVKVRWVDGVFFSGNHDVLARIEESADAGVPVELTPFGPTVRSGDDTALGAVAAISSYRPGRHEVVAAPNDVLDAIAEPTPSGTDPDNIVF